MVEKHEGIKKINKYNLEEVKTQIADILEWIRKVDKEMNIMNETIMPYSFPEPLSCFMGMWEDAVKDWNRLTRDSKIITADEINGFVPILNAWIDDFNQPRVKIRCIDGKKKGMVEEVSEEIAKMFIEMGWAEKA